MKNEKSIRVLKMASEIQLANLRKEHNKLDQISMLSGEGSELLEKINKTEGQIEAFKWILLN